MRTRYSWRDTSLGSADGFVMAAMRTVSPASPGCAPRTTRSPTFSRASAARRVSIAMVRTSFCAAGRGATPCAPRAAAAQSERATRSDSVRAGMGHPARRVLQRLASLLERVRGAAERGDSLLDEHHRGDQLEDADDDRAEPHVPIDGATNQRGDADRQRDEPDDADSEGERQPEGAARAGVDVLAQLELREANLVGNEALRVVGEATDQVWDPRIWIDAGQCRARSSHGIPPFGREGFSRSVFRERFRKDRSDR